MYLLERDYLLEKDVLKLLELETNKYKIVKMSNEIVKNQKIKIILIKCITKKYRCPICNKFTSSIHDTLKPIKLKHLTIIDVLSEIHIIKRRFICHNCNKRFIEPITINNKNCSLSNRLKIKIRKDLLQYNLSMKYIGQINGVSDITVRNELIEATKEYPEYIKNLPRVISIDEFKADTDYGKYACIINDPIHKKTIDILPSRRKDYLINYLTKVNNRHSVEYVISDMYEPYLIVTKVMFPKAKYVVDRYHYVEHVMDGLDGVRKRLQNEYGEKSREYKILKNKKNVALLRSYFNDISWYTYTRRYKNGHMIERLRIDILNEMLEISDELNRGYQLKEAFLDIVNHSTYETAKKDLFAWIQLTYESKIDEMIIAGKTIENWLEYIVNSFLDDRFTNGYTEGLNNKIKVIKRVGFGYKNFKFFRLRLLYILRGKISGK